MNTSRRGFLKILGIGAVATQLPKQKKFPKEMYDVPKPKSDGIMYCQVNSGQETWSCYG